MLTPGSSGLRRLLLSRRPFPARSASALVAPSVLTPQGHQVPLRVWRLAFPLLLSFFFGLRGLCLHQCRLGFLFAFAIHLEGAWGGARGGNPYAAIAISPGGDLARGLCITA